MGGLQQSMFSTPTLHKYVIKTFFLIYKYNIIKKIMKNIIQLKKKVKNKIKKCKRNQKEKERTMDFSEMRGSQFLKL
jgi:hypothetical protein